MVGVLSVLVSVLSVLVILLLGWQIYAMIDIKKTKEEVRIEKEKVLYAAEKANILTMTALSDFYYFQIHQNDPLGIEFKYTYYRVSSILSASRINDIETCNVIVSAILKTLKNPEQVVISKESKDSLIRLYLAVENKGSINGYNDMLDLLHRLKTS